jgi:hypothetical protein
MACLPKVEAIQTDIKKKVLMLLIYYRILHNPTHHSLTIFIFDLDRAIMYLERIYAKDLQISYF